jgi:single-strand DNA-binding protein
MNSVALTGHIGTDIDFKQTDSGKNIARFRLAVDRYSKGKKDTDWINVTAFGAQAENANRFLHKGSKCGIAGSIKTGSYEKQDGSKVYTTEVWANNVEFLDSKEDSKQDFQPVDSSQQGRFEQQFGQQGFQPVDEEDVPF